MKNSLTLLLSIVTISASAYEPLRMVPWGSEIYTNIAPWWETDSNATAIPIWQVNRTVNTNFASVAAQLGALPDAQTNSILTSAKHVVWSTNGVVLDINPGSRWVVPVTITNFNSISYTAVGQFSVNWSTNSGTNWSTGTPGPRLGNISLSFLTVQTPGFVVPVTPSVSNILIYSMSRPDLFGRTNNLHGQSLLLDIPENDSEAATKGYVDGQIAAINYPRNLAGEPLHLNEAWQIQGSSNSVNLRYLGSDVLSVANPALTFGSPTSISLSNGTVIVTVWTNGVTAALVPQWAYDIGRPTWSVVTNYTSTYPSAVGTNYVLTFPMPHPDQAFVRVGFVGSAAPTIADLNAILRLTPRTVTNSTDTTWGTGAGMVCVDTNYVYVSVGTNRWKRAALSAW
jgi:hypothetical protein